MTLTITSQAITLLSIDNVTQMKTATSDLDSVKAAIPVRVQEGGNYSYSISMQNSSDADTEYKTLLFYDVLPYAEDTKATDSNVTPKIEVERLSDSGFCAAETSIHQRYSKSESVYVHRLGRTDHQEERQLCAAGCQPPPEAGR